MHQEKKTLNKSLGQQQQKAFTEKKILQILKILPCDTKELSEYLGIEPNDVYPLLKDCIYIVPPYFHPPFSKNGLYHSSAFGQELLEWDLKKKSVSNIQDVYFENPQLVERKRILAMPNKESVPPLINNNLEILKKKYLRWLRNDVHFAIKRTLTIYGHHESGATNYFEKSDVIIRRAAKRGNSEYIKAVKERITSYNEKLPAIRFFNSKKRKPQKTSLLYMVLTTQPRRFKSRYDAWADIGKRLNKFISNLKRYFGDDIVVAGKTKKRNIPAKIHSSHSWECFYKKAKGYPHVNLVVYLKDKEVDCFSMLQKDKKTGELRRVWRMKKKHDLEKYWKAGFIDVYAISQVKSFDEDYIDDLNTDHPIREGSTLSVAHMLKYMTKNIRDVAVDEKTILLNAILWVLRKRSFSLSNMFVDMLAQVREDTETVTNLINRLANSNIFGMKFTVAPPKYELLGVYPACSVNCFKLHGNKPPPSCPYNKVNDGFGRCIYEEED